MKQVHREIIKRAGCDVLDPTIVDPDDIRRDLQRRLKRQEKALEKTIAKGWDGRSIIELRIQQIKQTLEVLNIVG